MMNTHQRRTRVAATVLGACALVAAPLPAEAASVPSCVKVSIQDYKRYDVVKATNTCDKGYHLKIIWAYETDSACEWVPGGVVHGTITSERTFPARFDGLAFC